MSATEGIEPSPKPQSTTLGLLAVRRLYLALCCCVLGKTLDASFLTGILCGVEDKYRCHVYNGYIGEKYQIKRHADV